MGTDELIRKVAATMDADHMAAPGERILVAVSGGVDSVALLVLLDALAAERGFVLTVAHLDHGLRGELGQADRGFVERLAACFGHPCVAEARAVGDGPNLEARARGVRHAFLQDAAATASCGRIALGHTKNDQAETVLLRLFRGAGARGLAAMSPRRGRLIRPLINCCRQDLVALLRRKGIAWREDETNGDARFTRNRVRRAMPLLEQVAGGDLTERLVRTASVLREEDAYLDGVALAALTGLWRGESLDLDGLAALPAAVRSRTLRLWLTKVRGGGRGAERRHVAAIERCLHTSGAARLSLPGGSVSLEGGRVSWHSGTSGAGTPAFSLVVEPGACVVRADLGWEVRISQGEAWASGDSLPSDPSRAVFDLEALPRPVVLRSVQPGDRIRPLGLDGTQKLQDLLVNAKVPRSARGRLPLLAVDGEVLWVPELSRSERALVRPETRQVMWADFRRLS